MAEQGVWWSVGMGEIPVVSNKLLAAPSQPQQVQGIKLNKLTLSPPPGIAPVRLRQQIDRGKAYRGGKGSTIIKMMMMMMMMNSSLKQNTCNFNMYRFIHSFNTTTYAMNYYYMYM